MPRRLTSDKSRAPLEYPGAGREEPEPAGIGEVALGLFGPDNAAHARGGSIWMGAALAIEDANRAGGYRGKPFRLVSRWTDDPWRGGASAVVKLVYTDRVWAVIGGIDGATTHLAEQVVAKALVPLVDTGEHGPDRECGQCAVDVLLRPGDPALATALAGAIKQDRVTLIASTDHDSRNLAAEFVKAAARRSFRIVRRIDVSLAAPPDLALVEGDACVVLAPAEQTAALAEVLPATLALYAGPAALSRHCRRPARLLAPRLRAPDPALEARLQAPLPPAGRRFFVSQL